MKLTIKSMIWNIQRQKKKTHPIRTKKKEKRIKKNEDSVSHLWDNFKGTNIHLIAVPEREEKEQKIGNLFEKIMKENFPNLVKEIDMQVQEAQRVPNKMHAKSPT